MHLFRAHCSFCKVSSWVLSSHFGASGLRSWGSHFCITPCDGPFLSGIFPWRSVPFQKRTLRFSPKVCVPFLKIDMDFGGSVSWNTQLNCLEFFNKATEPLPPVFFGFLYTWLSTYSCMKAHFSRNLHPDSVLLFWHSGRCQKSHNRFVQFPSRK